jgi:hypothetical protein
MPPVSVKLSSSHEVKDSTGSNKEQSEKKQVQQGENESEPGTPKLWPALDAKPDRQVRPTKADKPMKSVVDSSTLDSLGIRESVVIPFDDIARLMYYLSCVQKCINININPKLVDYKHYTSLTETEQRDVVRFANKFIFNVLLNVIFFDVDEDDENVFLRGANAFIDYDDPVMHGGRFKAPSNEVKIDGDTYTVTKVMVFKYSWMHDYFVIPFSHEQWRIESVSDPLLKYDLDKVDDEVMYTFMRSSYD